MREKVRSSPHDYDLGRRVAHPRGLSLTQEHLPRLLYLRTTVLSEKSETLSPQLRPVESRKRPAVKKKKRFFGAATLKLHTCTRDMLPGISVKNFSRGFSVLRLQSEGLLDLRGTAATEVPRD